MIMIVVVLRTKPSGLYRHRRGLGLHRVGYKGGDLHIRIAKLAFHAKERHGTKSSILYLHSPTVRPKDIVRLSGDPLIQDSLGRDGEDLLGGAMIWNGGEKLYSAGRVGRGSIALSSAQLNPATRGAS